MKISSKPGGSIPTDFTAWDSSWPKSADDKEQQLVWGYLEGRFGTPPGLRNRFTLWVRGNTYWVLSRRDSLEEMASLKVVSVGIPLARRVGPHIKPTTAALRALSTWIKRNRIRLQNAAVHELLLRGEIPWTEHAVGYVLLETELGVLGCGLIKERKLRSQIPRSEVWPFLAPAYQHSSKLD